MKTKKKYIAPTLELHTYRVESGFASSIVISEYSGDTYHNNGFELWEWNGTGGSENRFGGTGWDWEN